MTTLLDEPEQQVSTPTVRRVLLRGRFWIGVVLFVGLVVAGYTLLAPPSLTDLPLASDGTGQTGAGALVAVLGHHGVHVTATSSLSATRATIDDPAQTTVLVYDPDDYLDTSQLAALRGLASRVVLVSPGHAQLKAVDRNITLIGTSAASPGAHCELPAAQKAAMIADAAHAYRVRSGATGYVRCFPSGDNDFSLVQRVSAKSTFTVVGDTNAFTNRYIVDRGNAALAINLLGSKANLVWYLPSLEDVGAGGATETPAEAAPAWFLPLSVLVLLVIIAAAVWRGRRFGPLVVERLPVIVRSRETMEGRARLYQSTSARVRALDALRIGAITRLTRLCGLPRTAEVDAVIAAVAGASGQHLSRVREVLVDGIPHTDADLVRRTDDLIELETATAKATGAPATTDHDPDRTQ